MYLNLPLYSIIKMKILARENEKKILKELCDSNRPEFLALYGRRRVGKTYLIKNYFDDKGVFFHIIGVPSENTKRQIWNFSQVYAEVFNNNELIKTPESWQEALNLLKRAITKLKTTKKIILFFDELPWLANKKSGFIEALTYLWNRHFSFDSRIVMIVCGSAASWMINNIINSRGGLHNRITRKINLQPFNLYESGLYLEGKKIKLSQKQIIEIYMSIGGVAAYLDLVKPGKSSAQIISEICFDPDSPLFGEFDRLFRSLFNKSELHTKIIKTLLKNQSGMTREELFSLVNITSKSVQTRVKNELIESGFIAENNYYAHRKKGSKLRLVDEYSIFYLKWQNEINNTRTPVLPDFWIKMSSTNKWKVWAGYAFESICQNHVREIAKSLGISGIIYSSSTWSHKPETTDEKGVQIDLLIDRNDNCINLCELKFYDREFTLSKDYAQKLLYKRDKFIEVTKSKKTVFITMITSFGVKMNKTFHETVNNQLTIQDLFSPT